MRLALLIYLCTFCAVFFGFVSVLHAVLQPTILTNPGLSAYKAPAATVLYPQRIPPPEPDWQVAVDETASQPAPPPAAPEKLRPAKQSRQKPARSQRIGRQRYERTPMAGYTAMGYAAPEGNFHPWF
jgi:hypothetical protein